MLEAFVPVTLGPHIGVVGGLPANRMTSLIHDATLATIAEGERPIVSDDLRGVIHRELAKQGQRP